MKLNAWVLTTTALLIAGPASAASREVHYGPPEAWVMPPPTPTSAAPPEGSPVRVIYSDVQARLGGDGDETYTAYRVKILAPEALPLGNISAAWNPSADDLTVHRLAIIRAGQKIDVLANTKFQVIERENNLDSAILDGQLTASLQTPGLQVGDELEFAATVRHKDPTLGDLSHGLLALPSTGAQGAYRVSVAWPVGKALRWQATPDVGKIAPIDRAGERELTYELRDPSSAVPTEGAPLRFNVRRLIEYSGFASWADLSNRLWPLFDKASTLTPTSPVRQEANKIANSTSDPTARAEAALRLVEDRIRYVYIGLDGGNYRPASADDTWNRRFGDCKAKTALLMALLRELGINSEAVLVNSKGGDGTNQHLPTPGMFDHVLNRVTIGSKRFWLDGTRLGDRQLSALPPPVFRWALPLRATSVDLEAVPAVPLERPQLIEVIDVDASAGFSVPAKFKVQRIMRGDGIVPLRAQLSSFSAQDAERAEKEFWRKQMSWIEPETASWRYDELQSMLVLSMSGEGKPDWQGDDEHGRSLDIYGAGFTPPNALHRPKYQDQAAPWITEFPEYKCWATTIRLPPATSKWRWDYAAKPANAQLGGKQYWRTADLKDGVMRTVMSTRIYLPEISANQAKELNDRIPTFDNQISRVFQSEAGAAAHVSVFSPAANRAGIGIDWASPNAPCNAPNGTAGAGSIESPEAAYGRGDYATALPLLMPAGEQGDANAQFELGYIYDTGQGAPQDYAAAAKWYRRSADQVYVFAQSNLGLLYEYGHGVPQDEATAAHWYKRAADQGNAVAQSSLASMYEFGRGVSQDYAKATDWYRKAADKGDPAGERCLGLLYEHGRGVSADRAEAIAWLTKAAAQGDTEATHELAKLKNNK